MNYWKNRRILVTGGAGFVGSVIIRKLCERRVDPKNIRTRRSAELDLRRWDDCVQAVKDVDLVIHLAATVGGIGLNRQAPGKLFYDNAIMGIQLRHKRRRLLT